MEFRMKYFALLLALAWIDGAYLAVSPMKIFLVHIGDTVKRWKLESSIFIKLKEVEPFILKLKTDLFDENEISKQHRVEIFNYETSKYEEITTESLHKSLDSQKPEHLLVHIIFQQDAIDAPLCIMGRKFDTSKGLVINNRIISVKEQDKAELGTGLVSWDGSVVLAKHLEKNADLVRNKRILELGAGTGIAGLASWLLEASEVTLTDLSYTLENLRANVQSTIEANEFPSGTVNVSVTMLDWTDPKTYPPRHHYDVLLGADIVWLEHLVGPLVRTIAHLLLGSDSTMLLAHQTRSLKTDDALFSALETSSLCYHQVSEDDLAEGYRPSNIKVYAIQAKR